METARVLRIADKLEPLMPEKISKWRRLRQHLDDETRALMDLEILKLGHKVFGDIDKQMLLSLPPDKVCGGQVHLGRIIYGGERHDFYLKQEELNRHMAVFGSSGTGKTNMVFHILRGLDSLDIPFLFVDWKRTARHLLPMFKKKVQVFTVGRELSPLAFNPFSVPPGMAENVYLGRMLDTLGDAYTLGDASRLVVQRAISACYSSGNRSPSPAEVLEELGKLQVENPNWKASAIKALESLRFAELWGLDSKDSEASAKRLLSQPTILEVDSLSEQGKTFLIPCLLEWIYALKLHEPVREQLSLVVVLDEAHHFFYGERKGDNPMEIFMKECRELGIGLIIRFLILLI